MNNTEYKKIVAHWSVKRRNIIEDTIELLKDENAILCSKLQGSIDSGPIEKPLHHDGGKELDFFKVLLSEDEVQETIDILFDLEALAVPGDSLLDKSEQVRRTKEAKRIVSLLDLWNVINLEQAT